MEQWIEEAYGQLFELQDRFDDEIARELVDVFELAVDSDAKPTVEFRIKQIERYLECRGESQQSLEASSPDLNIAGPTASGESCMEQLMQSPEIPTSTDASMDKCSYLKSRYQARKQASSSSTGSDSGGLPEQLEDASILPLKQKLLSMGMIPIAAPGGPVGIYSIRDKALLGIIVVEAIEKYGLAFCLADFVQWVGTEYLQQLDPEDLINV